jgi:hypothetical protein
MDLFENFAQAYQNFKPRLMFLKFPHIADPPDMVAGAALISSQQIDDCVRTRRQSLKTISPKGSHIDCGGLLTVRNCPSPSSVERTGRQ